jgi:hypothetical protein
MRSGIGASRRSEVQQRLVHLLRQGLDGLEQRIFDAAPRNSGGTP